MSNYKILIIDYEPRSIEKLRSPLQKAGYNVEVAQDGLAGIEAFKKHRPHLTLIEAMLPKKHGFEVCQELKKTPHGKLAPILIITSVYKGRKYRTQALHHYGCNEYLEKPISDELLVATVRRFLDTPSTLSGSPGVEDASPPATHAGSTESEEADAPEVEIIDAIDELIPGEPDVFSPPPSDKVISFDPERSRKRRKSPSPAPPPAAAAPSASGSISRQGHPAAERAEFEPFAQENSLELSTEVQTVAAAQSSPKAASATVSPTVDRGAKRQYVWLGLALLLAILAGVVLVSWMV